MAHRTVCVLHRHVLRALSANRAAAVLGVALAILLWLRDDFSVVWGATSGKSFVRGGWPLSMRGTRCSTLLWGRPLLHTSHAVPTVHNSISKTDLEFWLDLREHPSLDIDAVAARDAVHRFTDDEVLMDIAQVIADLRLTARCGEAALAWCNEMGAAEMADISENIDDFAEALALNPEDKIMLKRAVEKVAHLGGAVVFEDVRRNVLEEGAEPRGVQKILKDLSSEVEQQMDGFPVPPPARGGVDAVVVSTSVAPAVIKECKEIGVPIFITEWRGAGTHAKHVGANFVCVASHQGPGMPLGIVRVLKPKLITSMTTRERQPTAEVWGLAEQSEMMLEDSEELEWNKTLQSLSDISLANGQRLAKMMPPAAKLWVQMLRQRQWTPELAKLPASLSLRRKKTDEGIIIYEGAPEGVTLSTGTGAYYPAYSLAKFFAWYASCPDTESLSGKHVLELGAGTGVVGLTLGSLGAHVTLTDFDVEALNLMLHNIRANSLAMGTALFLEWGDPTRYLTQQPIDIIVAAEVLYDMGGGEGDGVLLAHALEAHMKKDSRTAAYLSYVYRGPIGFFQTMLEADFRIERLEDSTGAVAGSSAGQPASVFEGSRFVELPVDKCMDMLQLASYGSSNPDKVQILRISRRSET